MGTAQIDHGVFDIEHFFKTTTLSRGINNKLVFKKGEFVFTQQEENPRIYFIDKGQVKIGSYSGTGKEVTKHLIVEKEMFGEMTLIGNDRFDDYAVALIETVVYSLSIADVQREMLHNANLNKYILQLIGLRLLNTEKRLERVAFDSSRDRIIGFLKDLAMEKGKPVGYEILVNNFISHQEIANMTATSRQTVTTTLNELRNDNLIYFNRRKLLIYISIKKWLTKQFEY